MTIHCALCSRALLSEVRNFDDSSNVVPTCDGRNQSSEAIDISATGSDDLADISLIGIDVEGGGVLTDGIADFDCFRIRDKF